MRNIAGWIIWIALIGVAGCQREPQPAQDGQAAAPASPAPDTAAAAAAAEAPAKLDDIIEHTPSYVIGVSFPKGLEDQPGLARLIRGYADAARTELMRALEGLGNDQPSAPYELSLSFDKLADTPALVAVAANGSRYTGGAHGEPLVARFVWLKEPQKQLTAEALVPDERNWGVVGQYVAARLHEAAAARAQADKLAPEEAASLLRSADKMIAEGTTARAANFAQFEPLVDGAGRIAALRFVFPPYQVGPYSDGTQTADVPASVLRPLVAQEYAGLFSKD
ncbi:DUF3298 and DUF4163 domain-containing protein [[Pseudomonas] boreopolis]|uniref:DUF3298 and DUF4163 domain-containing protein n=1 Tax=Xanthomonas boreopolis TaxID=86183 RepID=UPI003D9ACF7E